MESTICLYFQSGFCKFGELCRKQHVSQICSSPNCNSKSCRHRHPKPCRNFNKFNFCKFGELCAYNHKVSKEQNNVIELVNKIINLENIVKDMNVKISSLENEIQNIKNTKDLQKSEFSCDKCDYTASSSIVLKRHKTFKHKLTTLTSPSPAPSTSPSTSSHSTPSTTIPQLVTMELLPPTTTTSSPPPGTNFFAYVHNTPKNAPTPPNCGGCGAVTHWDQSNVMPNYHWLHKFVCLSGCGPPVCDTELTTPPT